MSIPYIIDLDDHEKSGIRTFVRYHANGEREEEMSAVIDGEGEHGLYNVTDTVMCKMPTGVSCEEASKMNHSHSRGCETFFVDSGLMYLYVDGKRCMVREGDIVHLQAGQVHAMASVEDVKWRGFFHDLDSFSDALQVNEVTARIPGAADDPAFQKAKLPRDFTRHERPAFTDIPAEQMGAVKHPSRPLAQYRFDGLTAKIIVPRWENAGVTELALGELEAGVCLTWGYHPYREQYYVRRGRVTLSIFGESYEAGKGCLVNVPKLAPFSLTALEDAEVYDTGGQTQWFQFLQDYESVRVCEPERFALAETVPELNAKFGIPLQRISRL